jgi:hypothetical protein
LIKFDRHICEEFLMQQNFHVMRDPELSNGQTQQGLGCEHCLCSLRTITTHMQDTPTTKDLTVGQGTQFGLFGAILAVEVPNELG